MLTPQTSELYLAALFVEAGLEKGDALRVAGRAHDSGFGRTSGEQRSVLEKELKGIREKAAAQTEAIARVIAEHYNDVEAQDVPDEVTLMDVRRKYIELKEQMSRRSA